MDITIRFKNDERTLDIPKYILEKYPESILSIYSDIQITSNNTIEFDTINYETFSIIKNAIINKKYSNDIIPILDKYGFVSPSIVKINNVLQKKVINELKIIDEYIHNNEIAFFPKKYEDYETYKNIFSVNNTNIIPVQIFMDGPDIASICIFNCIPISSFDYFEDEEVYLIRGDISDIIDVHQIRKLMFFDKIKQNCLVQFDYGRDSIFMDDSIYRKYFINDTMYEQSEKYVIKAIIQLFLLDNVLKKKDLIFINDDDLTSDDLMNHNVKIEENILNYTKNNFLKIEDKIHEFFYNKKLDLIGLNNLNCHMSYDKIVMENITYDVNPICVHCGFIKIL